MQWSLLFGRLSPLSILTNSFEKWNWNWGKFLSLAGKSSQSDSFDACLPATMSHFCRHSLWPSSVGLKGILNGYWNGSCLFRSFAFRRNQGFLISDEKWSRPSYTQNHSLFTLSDFSWLSHPLFIFKRFACERIFGSKIETAREEWWPPFFMV